MKTKYIIHRTIVGKSDNVRYPGIVKNYYYGKAGVTQPHRYVDDISEILQLAKNHGFATIKTAENYMNKYSRLFGDELYWKCTTLEIIPVEVEM